MKKTAILGLIILFLIVMMPALTAVAQDTSTPVPEEPSGSGNMVFVIIGIVVILLVTAYYFMYRKKD
jgi:LPXTG-motif cell wall-anchored protein